MARSAFFPALLISLTALGASKPNAPFEQFQKATPEEAHKAMQRAREQIASFPLLAKLHLRELETEHFLIFTDWDKRENDFLGAVMERAYTAVAKEFKLPTTESIFVGKLPVLMFLRYEDFSQHANLDDHYPVTRHIKGYFGGRSDGTGFISMWKPQIGPGENLEQAKTQWGYVLTHEFTHAFIARYLTNAPIPVWLNEGLAEIVADSVIPNPAAYSYARRMAQEQRSIQSLFSLERPEGKWYPVMRTVTETLLARDRAGLLEFIRAIKNGTPAPEALQKVYHWNYVTLEEAWRQYLRKRNG